MRLPLLLFTFMSGLSGCVIHVPMSELLMFTQEKPVPGLVAGIGLNYTDALLSPQAVLSEAKQHFNGSRSLRVNPRQLILAGQSHT